MAWAKLTPRNAWIPAVTLGLATFALNLTAPDLSLAARRSSLEANAMGTCRAYAVAQDMYKRHDWDGDGKLEYAHPFALLNATRDGTGPPIQLIDDAFALATSPATPKHGYWYRDCQTIGGLPIDWARDFALCATPSIYGRTGWHTFMVSTDGRVWSRDLGRSAYLADFPWHPQRDGWWDIEEGPPSRLAAIARALPAALAGLAVGLGSWLLIVLLTRKRREAIGK